MRIAYLLAPVVLAGTLAGPAAAGQWVCSPHPEVTSGYYDAGGNCAGHVDPDGDRLLFFETWTGTWTAHDLAEPHDLVAIEAGGDVVLYLAEDIAVAFDGPDRTVHEQPLTGQILETTWGQESWDCGLTLAVVVTDAAIHVYDAARDAWASLANAVAYPPGHFRTRAESDFVYSEIRQLDDPCVNLAYSRRTGTFARAEPGAPAIDDHHLLDHGFASFTEAGDQAVGYSALTGAFTTVSAEQAAAGYLPVDAARRALCHLWGFGWNEAGGPGEISHYHLRIYDTITGAWYDRVHDYDDSEGGHQTDVQMGGCFASNLYVAQDADPNRCCPGIFTGATHTLTWHDPGLTGAFAGVELGGAVAGYAARDADDHVRWWCTSDRHPEGLLVQPSRPDAVSRRAGEDWVVFGDRDAADPRMGLHFYHGDHNTVVSVETWEDMDTWGPDSDGIYAYCVRTYGSDVEMTFYSALRHAVVQHQFPAGSYPAFDVSDWLVLVSSSSAGNVVFDAITGVLHQRGGEFGNTSLGRWCCVGEDESAPALQAYSAITHDWATCAVDGPAYVKAGGRVALGYRNDRSRYWAFSAEEGGWTPLAPASGQASSSGQPGDRTMVVRDHDRLYAFRPDTWTAAPGRPAGPRSLAAALDDLRCAPNPFNGRLTVSFDLPLASEVDVTVFDVRGRRVARLLHGRRHAGPVHTVWTTSRTPAGVYLVRAAAGEQAAVRKIVLVE